MPNALRLLLAILATYRLAQMIALEEGPGGIFDLVRADLGAYDYDGEGEPLTNLGRGIRCPLCVGFWVSLPMTMLVLWSTWPGDLLLTWLGIAGGQTILHELSAE